MLTWGYKPDGSACLFDLADGMTVPPGWNEDHNIIADPAKRTAESISAAAGASLINPVRVESPACASAKAQAVAAGRASPQGAPPPARKRRRKHKISEEHRERLRANLNAAREIRMAKCKEKRDAVMAERAL